MPAEVVVVLSDSEFAQDVVGFLLRLDIDAMPIDNSNIALDVLERTERIKLLVTSTDFGEGQPNGVALACMARLKRPGIKVLFLGAPQYDYLFDGIGEVIHPPVTPVEVAKAALRVLRPGSRMVA
jgi:hypothetical protein